MSTNPCTGCGAPLSASPACEFCGRLARTPASADDEMNAVRVQALVLQRLATSSDTPAHTLHLVWQSSYMPTTFPAIRLALQSTMAALPTINDTQQAKQRRDLFVALQARATELNNALRFHPEGTDITRQESARNNRRIHDASESFRIAIKKNIIDEGTAISVSVGFIIAIISIMNASSRAELQYGTLIGGSLIGLVIAGIAIGTRFFTLRREPFRGDE